MIVILLLAGLVWILFGKLNWRDALLFAAVLVGVILDFIAK